MILFGNNTVRQLTRHHVTKPCARAPIAATTTDVIVAKAMCFLEGAP